MSETWRNTNCQLLLYTVGSLDPTVAMTKFNWSISYKNETRPTLAVRNKDRSDNYLTMGGNSKDICFMSHELLILPMWQFEVSNQTALIDMLYVLSKCITRVKIPIRLLSLKVHNFSSSLWFNCKTCFMCVYVLDDPTIRRAGPVHLIV